jgi:hypothetical protein
VPRNIQVWSNLFPRPWDEVLSFSTDYLHVHLHCSTNSHLHFLNTYITSWTFTTAIPCNTWKVFFLLYWNYLTHTKTYTVCSLASWIILCNVLNIYWSFNVPIFRKHDLWPLSYIFIVKIILKEKSNICAEQNLYIFKYFSSPCFNKMSIMHKYINAVIWSSMKKLHKWEK